MQVVISVDFNEETLKEYLLFDTPFPYNESITLHPVLVKDIYSFNQCQQAFTIRKDAIIREKKYIKMGYFDFLKSTFGDDELAKRYKLNCLPFAYSMVLRLLAIICGEDAKIQYHKETLDIWINECLITNEIFDDIRRIFFIQNDVDFDMDEFINIDTLNALEKAREFESRKNKNSGTIEDYIDSLAVGLKVENRYIQNLTIRKFWRYIKRLNKYDEYQACHNGEMSGMVTFKQPLQHWMSSMEIKDKYENLKANENDIRSKLGG